MPKIRHLAIRTKDPARLAKFYEKVFEMQVLHAEEGGRVFLSDGYFNVALLPNHKDGVADGLYHFGFHVDDVATIEERLKEFNEPLEARPAERLYAEYRAQDPDGNLFDVSAHGFQDVETGHERAAKQEKAKEKIGR